MNLPQGFLEHTLLRFIDIAEKAHRQMDLRFRKPAETADTRIEFRKHGLAIVRQIDADKESFKERHALTYLKEEVRSKNLGNG